MRKYTKPKSNSGWFKKGVPMPDEIRRKISITTKGKKKRPLSNEHRKHISETLKGRTLPEEVRIKIGLGNRGKIVSEKTRKIMSELKKGKSTWNKGRHLSEEWKKKLRESKLGMKNPRWQGGISFEPYSIDWTETLKRAIRERDGYKCFVCGVVGTGKQLDIHHIDYDKKNCNPNNLISLCRRCHCKTGFDRKYWSEYFRRKIIKEDIRGRRKLFSMQSCLLKVATGYSG